ncbi:MAG: TetR family transcriptional regulator [Nocardioides sp.]|nr:TetR family transcriptional regulator [Nocardioides sp.]
MARDTKQETRDRVLEAAERLFLVRGYTRVTIEDIASKAGYTRGAVYSSFAGKDEIFVALIDLRFDRQIDSAWSSLSASLTSEARLATLGRWMAAEFERARDWSTAEIEFAAHAATKPALRARLADMQRDGRRDLAAFLSEQCAAAGVTPPFDPEMLALVISSLARGLMVEWMVDLTTDVAGAFTATFNALLSPVGAPCPVPDAPLTH